MRGGAGQGQQDERRAGSRAGCSGRGARDAHLAVEAAGPQQRLVEDVGAVGGGQDDDAGVALEPVQLRQHLVDGLLALVVPAAHAGAALAPDGVDLVDEDDAGRLGLGLLEEITHARGAHAHEELDELGGGAGEEGHAGLAGDSLGQQGLARPRRAHQEAALGNFGPQRRVLLGALEEVDDLDELQLGAVAARHVRERHARLRDLLELGARLAEVHRAAHGAAEPAAEPALAALGTPEEEEEAGEGDEREEEVAEERHVVALLVTLRTTREGEGASAGRLGGLAKMTIAMPRRAAGQQAALASETEMSTPFLARMSTSSGSFGRTTAARRPSTAVSWSCVPSLEKRTRSTLPAWTARMKSL